MANYYISQSTGNDGNPGTEAQPFKTPQAIAASNFLQPGDFVYWKRGDEWLGSDMSADILSSGTSSGYITFDAYGSGANPMLTCSPLYTGGWTLDAGSIWVSNSTFASTVSVVGVDGNDVLCATGTSSYADLQAGNFFYNSTTDLVYVWMLDSSDPNSHDMYVGVTNTLRVKNSGGGNYIRYYNLDMRYANGIGWRATGTNVEFYNCTALGNAREGFHFSLNGITAPGAQYGYAYNCTATLCAAGNTGSGSGQGFTSEAADVIWESCYATNCFMAGFDFLDFNANTDVSRNQALWCIATNCGQLIQKTATLGDPGFYIDGANNCLLYGCISRDGGTGRNSARSLFLDGIQIANEHPVTKTVANNSVINCLSYNNTGYAFRITNPGTDTIDDTTVVNCTFVRGPSPAFTVMTFGGLGGAFGLYFRNNILHGIGGSTPIRFISTADAALFDSDNNDFYRTGAQNVIQVNGVTYTFTDWQALEGEDANSVFGDPLLVDTTASSFDAHLQAGSPALNIGDSTAWSGSPPVRGTTSSSGAPDSPPNDAGYHYGSEQSETVLVTLSSCVLSGVRMG